MADDTTTPDPDNIVRVVVDREQLDRNRELIYQQVSPPHRIDADLRRTARSIAREMESFKKLIEQAKRHRVHEVLGFASWPAYVADVISTEMGRLPVEDRRQVVGLLAGEGMSQRAIAEATKVSQKTVDRDLDQLSHDDSVVLPDNVIGLDNKTRPAHPPRPDVPKPPEGLPAWEPAAAPEQAAPQPAAARKRLKVPFGDDWMEGRFVTNNRDYPSDPIDQYVQNVASIGQTDKTYPERPELQDYDLHSPLGNTLPWLTGDLDPADPDDTYTARIPDEQEVAATFAKALRAALPRIEELIALLERRAT